jgi:Luciferase-like monooxygenase
LIVHVSRPEEQRVGIRTKVIIPKRSRTTQPSSLSPTTRQYGACQHPKAFMRFILTGLGNWSAAWKLVETGVREAEKRGFWGVVFPDQYMWDMKDLGVDSFKGIDDTLDTWIALTSLATQTRSIHLGTWVTPIPLRPPGILAKMVSTLDVISQGRTILGVGAGSSQRLFEGYSDWNPPRVRFERTKEGVELILRLWAEGNVEFKGVHYHAKGAVLDPKPVQKPHPPLLFGGAGPRMLRLAGRYADICYIPPWNKMSFEESKKIVLREARHYGREEKISFALAYTPLGPGQQYNREQYRKEVDNADKSRFDYFITAWDTNVAPWDLDQTSLPGVIQSYVACLNDFAENIMNDFQ